MKQFLYILLLATGLANAAASKDLSQALSPVKAGVPNLFVYSVFQNMLNKGVATATELNGGKMPTGQISAPYEAIASKGYPLYITNNPEMIADSVPFILNVNLDPKVQSAWQTVLSSRKMSLPTRTAALNIYLNATNAPLTRDEEKFIPGLKMAPHMVAIMIDPENEKLTLDATQQKVWNAIFASTASIMGAMEAEDHEAFALLFRNDIHTTPSSFCSLQ